MHTSTRRTKLRRGNVAWMALVLLSVAAIARLAPCVGNSQQDIGKLRLSARGGGPGGNGIPVPYTLLQP